MSFLRNSDVKKHLARSVPRHIPHPTADRLATENERALAFPPKEVEPTVLSVTADVPAKPDVL